MVTTRYAAALDLGPAAAYSALAVVEVAWANSDDPGTLTVGHLHRFPPGTPYARIAADTAGVLADVRLADAPLALDRTAVGAGVVPLFREPDRDRTLVSVVISAGHRAECGTDDVWRVPKADLVTALQLALQGRRLVVPAALPDAELLARELVAFRAKPATADPAAVDWREGRDDDLVLAVALAVWQAGRLDRGDPGGPFVTGRRHDPLGRLHLPGRARPW
ncbi:MAG TPA: hypothetical protein VM597_39505 [Gemmataceae bacterium]|nr:hypothetical protein [Gemmataceae bacterium]